MRSSINKRLWLLYDSLSFHVQTSSHLKKLIGLSEHELFISFVNTVQKPHDASHQATSCAPHLERAPVTQAATNHCFEIRPPLSHLNLSPCGQAADATLSHYLGQLSANLAEERFLVSFAPLSPRTSCCHGNYRQDTDTGWCFQRSYLWTTLLCFLQSDTSLSSGQVHTQPAPLLPKSAKDKRLESLP